MFKISYIYDLVDNISPQLKKIQSNLEATRSKVASTAQSMATSFDSVGKSLTKAGQNLKNVGTTLAPMSVGLGFLATKAIKTASEFEVLRIQSNLLTGSVEDGQRAFDAITQYAAKTPFQIQDISKSLNMLMSTGGMNFDEAMKSIKVIGDIAAISGGEMSGMALAFSQTASTTRLLGQDFNQFVNNSVPLMKIISNYTGKTSAEIMKMKEQGKLSFDIVAKAMEKATQKGGMFENGAENISKTLTGILSNAVDSINMALAEFGQEMVKSSNLAENITKISDYIKTLTERFKSLSPETKKFISYAVLIGAALAPVVLVLGSLIGILGLTFTGLSTLAGGFMFLASPVGLITAAIVGLSAAIYILKDDFAVIYNFLKDKLAAAFDYIAGKIQAVSNLVNSFRADASLVFDFVGLEKLSKMVAPELNQPTQINKPQQFTAGGQLNVNIKGLPKGSSAGFTPIPNNFLPVGVNSVFAGL